MGQGVSSEQINAHLARQSELIAQLQDVVDKQSKTMEQAATKHVQYSVNGASQLDIPISLNDELELLPSEARASENARRDVPVSAEELEKPNVEWSEPTEEEQRTLSVTKPWLLAMAPPAGFEFGKTDAAPPISLQLERVYGYKASGVRNTALWIDAETIVYYVGAVAISYNTKTNTQTFFQGHTEDICSITIDRQRKIVATGESGRFPAIFIWNAVTGEQLAKIAGRHRRGVTALCFGRDGSSLASVGFDDSNTLLIYEWQSGKLLGEGSCHYRVLDITPNYTHGHDPNTDFITAGECQVVFWSTRQSSPTNSTRGEGGSDLIVSTVGQIGNLGVLQPFLCVRSTRTHTLVGCANGQLYFFRDEKLVHCQPCHQGPIHSLQIAVLAANCDVIGDVSTSIDRLVGHHAPPPPEIKVFTAGRDGFVSCWNVDARTRLNCLNFNKRTSAAFLKYGTNAVRSLDIWLHNGDIASDSTRLVVGTIDNTLATCSVSGDNYRVLTTGHCADLSSPGSLEGELWGLAASPNGNYFATCGEDGMLRLWNSQTYSQAASLELPRAAQCLAFSRDGHSIAVGYLNGAIGIYTIHDKRRSTSDPPAWQLQDLCEVRRGARRIQCIQYSPDGKWLAAGTADGNVDLYEVSEDKFAVAAANAPTGKLVKSEIPTICPGTLVDYRLKVRLIGASNSVCMRFDFSKDGRYIQACSQSYELLFYDLNQEHTTPTGKGVPQLSSLPVAAAREVMANVEWSSYSSFLGWSVQGIWRSSNADGSDVNAVRRSSNGKYLITGCDNGQLRLYQYPCVGSGLDREGRLPRRPESKAVSGHGKHVAEVVWSADDRKVFSIGASDRCCLQWKVVADVQ